MAPLRLSFAQARRLVRVTMRAGQRGADTKFAAHHFSEIERLAVVGETKWQHGMARFCKPFTTATVRYFDPVAINEALAWLEAD